MVLYYFPENVHEEALSLCFGVAIEDEYNPCRTRVYRAKDESIQIFSRAPKIWLDLHHFEGTLWSNLDRRKNRFEGFPEYTIKFEHIKRNFDRQASFPDSNLIKFNHVYQ